MLGGEPQLWLKNASGLVWTGPASSCSRRSRRGSTWESWRPRRTGWERAMSTCPPTRRVWRTGPTCRRTGNGCCWWKWTRTTSGCLAAWFPRTAVRRVTPWVRRGGCTFGAWSPDGKWIYLTSNAVGGNHIWRQRFPDGRPEQITSGPTEEEGIAMAPDGRSFVTAVALQNTSLWATRRQRRTRDFGGRQRRRAEVHTRW